MRSAPPGPAAPAIDHDRFFKELLTQFFGDFLELFFPKLAQHVDAKSFEFLSQELYVNKPKGKEYRADIVAKACFQDDPAFFLIHVEHQSAAPPDFPTRFFTYYAAIYGKHAVPIYPIVIYSHDKPYRQQPDTFKITFPDRTVLTFRYRVVQLNRLQWRRFLKVKNPVAAALMSKMKIAPRDRPRVKLECLRLLLTLKLDAAKMAMIGQFVDAYLRLNDTEEQHFQESMEGSGLQPKERKRFMEYVTSWEERGIEKGVEQGIEQGIDQTIAYLHTVLIDILTTRFGGVSARMEKRIRKIRSLDQLQTLAHEALTVPKLSNLKF